MGKMRRCDGCEFRETRTSISNSYSSGMKADFCGKLLDDGKDRIDTVIILIENCPLDCPLEE